MPIFRTKDELLRTQWAAKFQSVTEGKQYTTEDDEHSPFPIHSYLKNKLLGKNVKMLEVNAGSALIEHFVADTLTELTIKVDEQEKGPIVDELWEWLNEIDYEAKLDEVARSFYGTGYGVMQLFRTEEEGENGFTAITLDSSTWYPDIPTFSWQKVTSGRVISVFSETTKKATQWYAFIEEHKPGSLTYRLYSIDGPDALEGKDIGLSRLSRFEGLAKSVTTDLDIIPIVQADRQKSSRHICGQSVLYPIWGILQEISETQTQIRQERIKHLRAKLAAAVRSLQRVDRERSDGSVATFKQAAALAAENAALFDVNQEIIPLMAGDPTPAYIQRDLESISKGIDHINDLLSKAAAIVGCPRHVLNLEEAGGNVKVEVEKRKDRRYMRKVIQGQSRIETSLQQLLQMYWFWKHGEEIVVEASFADPFNLSQEEQVALVREMNPTATLISEEDAVRRVHSDKTPEEVNDYLARIKGEKRQSELARPTDIVL
ncbi:MAG TPA: hypothetical protein VGN57_19065 [Pirellulaceae bacterium]|jgi:hypothetical protein|nr:hypothetical protein [Pirellulaceae bacterium]